MNFCFSELLTLLVSEVTHVIFTSPKKMASVDGTYHLTWATLSKSPVLIFKVRWKPVIGGEWKEWEVPAIQTKPHTYEGMLGMKGPFGKEMLAKVAKSLPEKGFASFGNVHHFQIFKGKSHNCADT